MIDTWRGSCAVLDIVEGNHGPDLALLRDELVALVKQTAVEAGIVAPTLLGASAHRVVLGFAPRPAHHRSIDRFLDALATSLDRRNSSLDLRERLRVAVTVDNANGAPDRFPASPLSTRVLARTPASSLVIEATERWHAAAAKPDESYRSVDSRLDTFWLRIPGRSRVPGLDLTDLDIEPRPRHEVRPAPKPKSVFPAVTGDTRLDGSKRERLRIALAKAYPSFDEFALMLSEKLDLNLHDLASDKLRLALVVSKAIEHAAAHGWIDRLVTAGFLGNPGNPALRRLIHTGFCDEAYAMLAAIDDPTGSVTRLWPHAGLLTDLVDDGSGDADRPWSGTTLERIFRRTSAFQDVLPFTSRLLSAAGRVCQVRVGSGGGTGFLVGPDLVLTNHHVVEDVINGQVPRSGVRCVFDHLVDDAGRVQEGVGFELTGEGGWLVASSPPSEVDEQVHPTRPPTTGELDYALIRLAEPAGRSRSLDGRERGWLSLLGGPPVITPGLPLLIVQHPLGLPMKLAISETGVGAVVGRGTRVTYKANTARGSSGSPCLTFDLQLVALHQSGGPEHNVGIPISTIAAHYGVVGPPAPEGT